MEGRGRALRHPIAAADIIDGAAGSRHGHRVSRMLQNRLCRCGRTRAADCQVHSRCFGARLEGRSRRHGLSGRLSSIECPSVGAHPVEVVSFGRCAQVPTAHPVARPATEWQIHADPYVDRRSIRRIRSDFGKLINRINIVVMA